MYSSELLFLSISIEKDDNNLSYIQYKQSTHPSFAAMFLIWYLHFYNIVA